MHQLLAGSIDYVTEEAHDYTIQQKQMEYFNKNKAITIERR
jgi:hypothetical protein